MGFLDRLRNSSLTEIGASAVDNVNADLWQLAQALATGKTQQEIAAACKGARPNHVGAALARHFIPYWAKDIKIGFSTLNARAEEGDTKPAFREAFQRRRCLVPVDNFYEWKKTATGKQPYAIALADRRLMALAGLWETWRSPAGEDRRIRVEHPEEQTPVEGGSRPERRWLSQPEGVRKERRPRQQAHCSSPTKKWSPGYQPLLVLPGNWSKQPVASQICIAELMPFRFGDIEIHLVGRQRLDDRGIFSEYLPDMQRDRLVGINRGFTKIKSWHFPAWL